ncbi:MAG TPA: polysaccharide deacetylase family protein [candidate division Zixibacteria bacterium]|nr:polysaccharide deacetylase family protein [candidate division Zixibacteria bacterium]
MMAASQTLAFHHTQPRFSWGVTNYSPRRLARLLAFLDDGSRTFGWDPLLTFDDAYESFYTHAAPLLLKYHFKSRVFAPSRYLGRRNSWDYASRLAPVRHLTAPQLLELDAQGFDVQSHGHRHCDLTELPDQELATELETAKAALEDVLGREVSELCYPYGRVNPRVEAAAQAAGFARGWSLDPAHRGPFTFGRWGVYAFDTPLTVRAKLNGGLTARMEYCKVRLTNTAGRAGRFAFWTD